VTVGLFKVIDMVRIAMPTKVKNLLSSYNFLDKLFAYVKNEGGNLPTLA